MRPFGSFLQAHYVLLQCVAPCATSMTHFRLIFCRHLSTLNLRCKLVYTQITSKLRRAVPQNFHLMSLKIMLNIGAQFQYSDRLIENSNPQKITFSEVLRGALHVLSWQPISLFISERISSYSAYILINKCSLIWYRFCFREMNTF